MSETFAEAVRREIIAGIAAAREALGDLAPPDAEAVALASLRFDAETPPLAFRTKSVHHL